MKNLLMICFLGMAGSAQAEIKITDYFYSDRVIESGHTVTIRADVSFDQDLGPVTGCQMRIVGRSVVHVKKCKVKSPAPLKYVAVAEFDIPEKTISADYFLYVADFQINHEDKYRAAAWVPQSDRKYFKVIAKTQAGPIELLDAKVVTPSGSPVIYEDETFIFALRVRTESVPEYYDGGLSGLFRDEINDGFIIFIGGDVAEGFIPNTWIKKIETLSIGEAVIEVRLTIAPGPFKTKAGALRPIEQIGMRYLSLVFADLQNVEVMDGDKESIGTQYVVKVIKR